MTIAELQAFVVFPVAIAFVIRVRTGHGPRWLQRRQRTRNVKAQGVRRPTTAAVAVSAVVVGALPWLVYVAVRSHVHTAAQALLISSCIPLVWVLGRWGRRRHVDAVGVAVMVAYAVAVALSFAFGGSALPLKLRDVAALALVGVACLVSTAIRRPLLLAGLKMVARSDGDDDGSIAVRLADPDTRGDLGAATVLAGALFLAAAATDGVLIPSVSTSTFLAIAGPLGGLTPLVTVVAAIGLLRRRSHRHHGANARPSPHATV